MTAIKREVVVDTETTGLDPLGGDRIVEIGCVELLNHIPTGRHFHRYLNPDRPMSEDAFNVHGLSDAFLSDKPRFHEIAAEFAEFISEATLIIHNAPFDLGFFNAEHARIRRPELANEVIDTVALARTVHPGARVSLDALCKHYGIDTSRRALHGALLDSQILADVYLELIGGRQVGLALGGEPAAAAAHATVRVPARPRPLALPPRIDAATLAAHQALLQTLGSEPLWAYYGAIAG